MKRKIFTAIIAIAMVLGNVYLNAQDASPSQFFYVIKRLMPETKEISIFMPPESIEKEKVSLSRAALQNQLKVKIFPISSAIELGKNIRNLNESGVLIVYSSDVLMRKSSAVYVLQKCIEKNIAVVSSSQAYSDFGAFLGLVRGADKKLNIIVNLKQYASLQSKVTQERMQLAGVTQIIE